MVTTPRRNWQQKYPRSRVSAARAGSSAVRSPWPPMPPATRGLDVRHEIGPNTAMDPKWMHFAIEQARTGIDAGQTPFGAVVVRAGKLIAAGHNEVWATCDSTAHGEVVAIRRATAALRSISLAGCEMYSSCEPCPMCASAIHWANLDAIYFGATIADAQTAGFRELTVPIRELYDRGGSRVRVVSGVMQAECAALFAEWKAAGKSGTY